MSSTCSSSRRKFALRAAAIPAGLSAVARAFGASNAMAASAPVDLDGISHAAAAIHQEVLFAASRHRIYRALTDPEQFDKVVRLSAAMAFATKPGAPPTHIAHGAGAPFSLFGGYLTGQQIEWVTNERIVQAWRAGSWDPGAYSIASFVLKEEGSKTRLFLDHRGFPDDQADHLAQGWHVNYWEPLARFLAQG